MVLQARVAEVVTDETASGQQNAPQMAFSVTTTAILKYSSQPLKCIEILSSAAIILFCFLISTTLILLFLIIFYSYS